MSIGHCTLLICYFVVMYAVIDIESSGGKRGQERIIEIAIFRFDGQSVTDQMISLVNVSVSIHPYVQKLTGITPAMLRRAPKFHELAKRIIEITEDAVIVGHNVSFDYRLLEQEFASLGYEFRRKTLDTIPMTQKLIPGLKSYGLENISRELNIFNPQRHRAAGDARVTLELFKILLEKDQNKDILRLADPQLIPAKNVHDAGKLARLLDVVQPATGVYYLRNEKGEICRTGYAKNLYTELHHIFLLDDQLKDRIADVQTELTGSDLISQLKLYTESSRLSKFVKSEALKMPPWQIVWTEKGFNLQKSTERLPASIILTEKRKQALALFKKIADTEGIMTLQEAFFAIKKIIFPYPHCIIRSQGRTLGETALVVVENYSVIGYGYYRLNHEVQKFDAFRRTLTPVCEDAYTLSLLASWIQKQPGALVPLPSGLNDLQPSIGVKHECDEDLSHMDEESTF